jgi:hypothetical protein
LNYRPLLANLYFKESEKGGKKNSQPRPRNAKRNIRMEQKGHRIFRMIVGSVKYARRFRRRAWCRNSGMKILSS